MQKTLTEIKTLVADIGPGVLKGFRKDDVYICICIVGLSEIGAKGQKVQKSKLVTFFLL